MQDFIVDDSNDVKIVNGDFVIGNSDEQNQKLLLLAEKGSFKEVPGVGVGAFSFLENEDVAGLLGEIRRQFTRDGMAVNKINYTETGKLEIDADY